MSVELSIQANISTDGTHDLNESTFIRSFILLLYNDFVITVPLYVGYRIIKTIVIKKRGIF